MDIAVTIKVTEADLSAEIKQKIQSFKESGYTVNIEYPRNTNLRGIVDFGDYETGYPGFHPNIHVTPCDDKFTCISNASPVAEPIRIKEGK